MWIHANVEVRAGARIFNGPAQHRWHHAIDYVAPGKNFATKLAIWDHLFGTVDRRTGKPSGYGLEEPFPDRFLAQQAHAFRRLRHEPAARHVGDDR
jgi:sterol desaturase/sphingolipid hydroxylase (fatty acid hydroxylase superfamily)